MLPRKKATKNIVKGVSDFKQRVDAKTEEFDQRREQLRKEEEIGKEPGTKQQTEKRILIIIYKIT